MPVKYKGIYIKDNIWQFTLVGNDERKCQRNVHILAENNWSFTYITYILFCFLLYTFTRFIIHFMFLSDEGPTLETLDFEFRLSGSCLPITFYISIFISTLYAYTAHCVYFLSSSCSHEKI